MKTSGQNANDLKEIGCGLAAEERADVARQMRDLFGPLTGESLEDGPDVEAVIKTVEGKS